MKKKIVIPRDDWNMLSEMVAEMECVSDAKTKERLRELEDELQACKIVDRDELPPEVVTINSTVEFSDVDTGETTTYTLVPPAEADISSGRMSVLSPVGTALLGYKTGDIVEWAVPSGNRRLKIGAVTQP